MTVRPSKNTFIAEGTAKDRPPTPRVGSKTQGFVYLIQDTINIWGSDNNELARNCAPFARRVREQSLPDRAGKMLRSEFADERRT